MVGLWSVNETISICDVPVLSTQVKPVESARDLGFIIDSQLSLSAHVAALCRSCYYQLRQLRPEIRSLTSDAAKTLLQAFITCRLDYCNSLLFGVSNYLIRKVQSVQNAAARLITGTRRCEHIIPVLHKLHWLPDRQRVKFKLAYLVHQSLAEQTPPTLAVLSFDPRLRGYVSFHAHTTASATEVFQLPVLVCGTCGTPCHHICGWA